MNNIDSTNRHQNGSLLPARVCVMEVGLRDGIQNQATFLPTHQKISIINSLVAAGVEQIQVTSFVNPRVVPQLADAEEVCAHLPKVDGVIYNGLVLNMKGLLRAHAAGLTHVDLTVAATETQSQKNMNCSMEVGMDRLDGMVTAARQKGMHIRVGIQSAFGCAYEGAVPDERLLDLSQRIIEMGVDVLALADSTGMANPVQIERIIQKLRPLAYPTPVALHLHDTRGMGLANVLAALKNGITQFDTSFGGLGGCPFIPKASGNIATEDTVNMFHQMGISTGIDLGQIAQISHKLAQFFGTTLPGKLYQLQE